MTASDLIAAFNGLDVATFPDGGEDDDEWGGESVVKLSALLAILGHVARRLEHEQYGDLVRPS